MATNLQYREALSQYTLVTLNNGYSVSLVGVGSVGKSNFLRHVMKQEVQSAFLGPEAESLHLIYIDPNNLLDSLPLASEGGRSGWAGYEIMTQRLYRYFWVRGDHAPAEIMQALGNTYQQLHDGRNPLTAHVALRHFEYAVDLIIRSGYRLVFIFDEFEEMFKALPSKFFRTLRGLRDDYKYQLTYLTTTRKPMTTLISEQGYDYDALEPFIELFSDTTRYITAYNLQDAVILFNQIADRQSVRVSDRVRDLLIRISGGHAGLLRAAFSIIGELPDGLTDDKAAEWIARYDGVRAECNSIMQSLNQNEANFLTNAAAKTSTTNTRAPEASSLLARQLITVNGNELNAAPPLLRAYLRSTR
jgi:hypothetical protein